MIDTITTLALTTAGAADHDPWRDGGGPPGHWPVFPLVWILSILAAATLAVWLSRRSRSRAAGCAGEAHLAERYAAGEIDEEEYRARRAVLRAKR